MRYRKKPIVISAIQWTGENESEIAEFAGTHQFHALSEPCGDDPEATASVLDSLHSTWVLVYTGDWIIRGVKGEFYPCRDQVFRETYDPAE